MKVVTITVMTKHDNECESYAIKESNLCPDMLFECVIQELRGGDWLRIDRFDASQEEYDALPGFKDF